MKENSNILIYQNENGNIKVDVRFEEENIWLSQKQLAEVFNKSVKTINEHINNIFNEDELSKDAVIRNYRITASDGKNYDKEEQKTESLKELEDDIKRIK